MATWSGFSDSELRSMKESQQQQQKKKDAHVERRVKARKFTAQQCAKTEKPVSTTPEPLSVPAPSSTSRNQEAVPAKTSQGSTTVVEEVKNNITSPQGQPDAWSSSTNEGATISFERPGTNLEELTKQRQLIEEENKRKKAILEKALQERYKQTQAEAHTLASVKQQLDKLDNLLSQDVSVLRDKIEQANRDYNSARKRFENAEHEYVLAKINLHKATELKELLSEHLCAVVQENEVRKAKKLSELTEALKLGEDKTQGAGSHSEMFQRTPTPRSDVWPHRQPQKKSTQESSSLVNRIEPSDLNQQLNEEETGGHNNGTSTSAVAGSVDDSLVPSGVITLD